MNLTGNFDKLNQGKTTDVKDVQAHESGSNVRNLCFVQTDGKQIFLNYSYLVSVECSSAADEITISFTSHKIVLRGRNLQNVFEGLFLHGIKRIFSTDARYEATMNESETLITDIKIYTEG